MGRQQQRGGGERGLWGALGGLLPGPPTHPRARPKACVWLQLALVCALTACPTTHTDAQGDFISLVRQGAEVDHAGRLYWIQDPRDELCVGEAGMMMPCGDSNLWGVRGKKGGYTLELISGRQIGPHWSWHEEAHAHPSNHRNKHAECLTRQHCFRASSDVHVSSCASCGAKGWSLEASGRISQDGGRLCLVRTEDGRVRTEGCGSPKAANSTGAFRLVEYRPFFEQQAQLNVHYNAVGVGLGGSHAQGAGAGEGRMIVEGGMVKDEESGLKFPPDLSVFLGEEHKGHVYMGGGAFRFFGINVYQVALYIDAARAAASPRLRPFAGQSRAELQGNQSFYDAMMTPEDPVKYSRSIYIKLLIPLKASTMKGALEDSWNIEPEAKKIFLDTSFKHAIATRCCSIGTELLFTWTPEDLLEVRLNNRLVETFSSTTLAHELFLNYVNDDPISPQAKKGFVAHYPELLAHPSKQRKRDMLKQQWQHSQQLLANGQKALLSHVHVPHAPHLPSVSMPAYPSLASLSSWWQGSGGKRRAGAAGSMDGGEHGEAGIGEDGVEGEEAGRRHRYAPREEPRDVRAHKSLRRWVVALLLAYGVLLVMSLSPGSRRRFQERLRRGGGSMRALALQRSKHEWDLYLRRTVSHSTSMAALGRR